MSANVGLINWLDPVRTGTPGPFLRDDIFAIPRAREILLNNGEHFVCWFDNKFITTLII